MADAPFDSMCGRIESGLGGCVWSVPPEKEARTASAVVGLVPGGTLRGGQGCLCEGDALVGVREPVEFGRGTGNERDLPTEPNERLYGLCVLFPRRPV